MMELHSQIVPEGRMSQKSGAAGSPWVHCFNPQEDAAVRLFCLPFSGGGAQSFSGWVGRLPLGIDLCAIQLPGRETRMREVPFADVHTLIDVMAPALQPWLNKPMVLFGHSMGALIAYELARRLQQDYALSPRCLIVSGRVAPHCSLPQPPMNKLPQSEFIGRLRQLNGTPDELLNNTELMDLITPTLRADFSLHEEYSHRVGTRLQCDILAFGGINDPHAGRAAINLWRDVTDGQFRLRMVPGGHFFIQSAQSLFLRILSMELYSELKDLLTPRPGVAARTANS
jgi:medium-chain acyl-[acyl-carrier-protein] hydrolase